FAAGAIIGGGVEVGDNSVIGIGAKVIQYKKVGKNCLIDIGTIVIRDILMEGTYFGIPARRVEF
ncbi:MAG: hexapeptide transferase, partial [Ignavibacteria bacterium]|nr:hexapeptide transferase [Ignavibacteria bacterium]